MSTGITGKKGRNRVGGDKGREYGRERRRERERIRLKVIVDSRTRLPHARVG